MKPFDCPCGNTVFFESTHCVACRRSLGWCPSCRSITALAEQATGTVRCEREGCSAELVRCYNYEVEAVCNRSMLAPGPAAGGGLCDYCRFNRTVPDLSVEGNREKWARLEAAKRRLLYTLDLVGLPYGAAGEGVEPPLSFEFKADVVQARGWWKMGPSERVFTGHANGNVTINLMEADAVEREKARVYFQEAHRTIIGHFRHEIGHYYWQMLVQGSPAEEGFVALFGNHESPTYAEAQDRYYENGPLDGWEASFVSPYASMHPWEDFAETFATYLDMVSVLDTARHTGVGAVDPTRAETTEMVRAYGELGLVVNEMNRAMGLVDLVPEVLGPKVVEKLSFVHSLVHGAPA